MMHRGVDLSMPDKSAKNPVALKTLNQQVVIRYGRTIFKLEKTVFDSMITLHGKVRKQGELSSASLANRQKIL